MLSILLFRRLFMYCSAERERAPIHRFFWINKLLVFITCGNTEDVGLYTSFWVLVWWMAENLVTRVLKKKKRENVDQHSLSEKREKNSVKLRRNIAKIGEISIGLQLYEKKFLKIKWHLNNFFSNYWGNIITHCLKSYPNDPLFSYKCNWKPKKIGHISQVRSKKSPFHYKKAAHVGEPHLKKNPTYSRFPTMKITPL